MQSDEWVGAADQFFDDEPREGADYKLTQLCSQVEEAVVCALASSFDPALRDMRVVSVVSARGAALLRVTVESDTDDADGVDGMDRVFAKLTRAKGYLRAEVASAITRKRAPELVFVVVPTEDEVVRLDE